MLADEEGLTFLSFSDEFSECDRERSNASYYVNIFKFGACAKNEFRREEWPFFRRMERSSMAGSYMYLANVNDTIAPYIFDNQPIQAYQGGSSQCESFDNCSPTEGWRTQYQSVGCLNPQYSTFNPNEVWNTCMNYNNETYAKVGCFDENGSYLALFEDSECTKPSVILGSRRVCETTSQTIYCGAQITQFPRINPSPLPPIETSTASSVLSSFLILTFLLLLSGLSF
jgi:hypothetical protein